MPTGYTYILEKRPDITFREFALRCSRAFGAMVMFREDSLEVEIPEKLPSDTDYEERSVSDRRQALVDVMARSLEEWTSAYEYAKDLFAKRQADSDAKAAEWRRVCERLIVEAKKWRPPSNDHEGLQKFILEQLGETVRHDGTPIDFGALPDFEEWKEGEKRRAVESLRYAERALAEAKYRATTRQAWLDVLRAALPLDGEKT